MMELQLNFRKKKGFARLLEECFIAVRSKSESTYRFAIKSIFSIAAATSHKYQASFSYNFSVAIDGPLFVEVVE